MARKLDAREIEAKRLQRKSSAEGRERAKQQIREGFEENKATNRTRVIKPPECASENAEQLQKRKTAAYVRVSTAEEQQAGSFEAQLQHFKQVIENNPLYEMAGIYSDDGVSGTSIDRRVGFKTMIEAAKRHEIDLILVKSISRFGRNTLDVLSNIRLLNDLSPPVTVFFEQESLFTSDESSKLVISILSALAELESQQKSEAIKAGIRWRMKEGIYKFTVSNTLGYYRDHFGRVKIEHAEAEIVRYIYESFLEGVSPVEIAEELTKQEIRTPKGLYVWRTSTILGILRNEKYNGSALMQKTITKDYLTHRSIKNTKIEMYLTENAHEAIIAMAEWEKVQEELSVRHVRKNSGKIKNFIKKFYAPRIKGGALKGFYLLDGNWTADEREKFLQIIKSLKNLES